MTITSTSQWRNRGTERVNINNLFEAHRESGERVDLKAGDLMSEAVLLINDLTLTPPPMPTTEARPALPMLDILPNPAKQALTRSAGSFGVWPWVCPQVDYNKTQREVCKGLGVCVGEGHGTPLQYSCLENPMDGGAW